MIHRVIAFSLILIPFIGIAEAGIPSSSTSHVPALVACPAGDLSFIASVRDAANNPVPSTWVWVDLSNCPGFLHCPGATSGYTWDPIAQRASIGPLSTNGLAMFAVRGGGKCEGVWFIAEGVLLNWDRRFFSSTDLNGDLRVDASDLALIAAKLGTFDYAFDFDSDFQVTEADVAVVQAHLGHDCNHVRVEADAGRDTTVECAVEGGAGTAVDLDGSRSTGSTLTYFWSSSGATFEDPAAANTVGHFPLGTTTVTLRVQSGSESSEDNLSVTVRDTRAPLIQVRLEPSIIWPPDRQMVPVHATVVASDACDPTPAIRLLRISSVELDATSGPEDGDESDQDGAIGSADFDFSLRAERSGQSSARVYSACYEALDGAGNRSEGCADVLVPHDRAGRAQLDQVSGQWVLTLFGSATHDVAGAVARSVVVRAGHEDWITAHDEDPVLGDIDGDSYGDARFRMGSSTGDPPMNSLLWARWRTSGHDYLSTLDPIQVTGISAGRPADFGVRTSANPAFGKARLEYRLPAEGHARIRVFDVRGRLQATLVDAVMPAGNHSIGFSSPFAGGGLYFYSLEWQNLRARGKFVVMR